MNPFIYEICEYAAGNIPQLSFGSGDTNLKIGDLFSAANGVIAVQSPSVAPDLYTPIRTISIDFYAHNNNSTTAFGQLQDIYDLFHQAHHFDTDSYRVFFSYAAQDIQDLDRDTDGSKVLRLSVVYILASLIS